MVKNLEELRSENPELAATVEANAKAEYLDSVIQAERQRLHDIDEIAAEINDDALVYEAKYGANPCTASELSYRAALNKSVDCGVKAAKGPPRKDY